MLVYTNRENRSRVFQQILKFNFYFSCFAILNMSTQAYFKIGEGVRENKIPSVNGFHTHYMEFSMQKWVVLLP